MAVNEWIDAVTALWDGVSDGRGGQVRSYRVFERAEFPESLSTYPCAITYISPGVKSEYSVGGPCIDFWKGMTEFHLFPSVDKSNLPALMLYFARIRDAAASAMTLGGRVARFQLDTEREINLAGPVTLRYGGESEHLGIMVYWEVKESTSGDFSVAA